MINKQHSEMTEDDYLTNLKLKTNRPDILETVLRSEGATYKYPKPNNGKFEEDFAYNYISKYNVDKIANIVKDFDQEWLLEMERQKTYVVHENSYSYFIYDHTREWTVGESYKTVLKSDNQELINFVQPIIDDLEKIHNGKVGMAVLIKLTKKSPVWAHRDYRDYLNIVRRNHIAIITDPKVLFMIDGEFKHLEVGDCWEINNNKIHAVSNEANIDRVHLMIDIIPQHILDLGKK